MAIEFKSQGFTTNKQILAIPDHYVAIAVSFTQNDSIATDVEGRKIVKAGTIYPANDATAKGVIFYDCDVTDGDAVGALIIHGFVQTSKLPAEPVAAAKGALPMIAFLGAQE